MNKRQAKKLVYEVAAQLLYDAMNSEALSFIAYNELGGGHKEHQMLDQAMLELIEELNRRAEKKAVRS